MALDALICVGNEKYFTTPSDVSAVTSLCRSQRVEEALWDSIKNISSEKKRTRLMYAAKTNDVERIQFLLERNADINFKNKYGCTALHYACEYGQMEAVKQLVSHSSKGRGRSQVIDVNSQDDNGMTAVMKCTLDVNMVDYLLHNGASPFITDCNKRSILHLACGQFSNEDSAEYLITMYPVLCKLQTINGYTALHYAVRFRTVMLVKLLLPHSDINAMNNHGHTALSLAIKVGKKWMVEALLEAGAMWTPSFKLHTLPNWMQNHDQSTYFVDSPLHFAAKYNQVDILKYLLQLPECQVNKTNDEGETAFWRACRQGSVEAAKILYPLSDIYKGCTNSWTPLNIAVLSGNYKIVEYFCDQKANLTYQIPLLHRQGDTALVVACENNMIDMVKLLVSHMTSQELHCFLPMSIAIRNGFTKVVEVLLKAHANSGLALELACELNRSEIVELLLDNGHSVNQLFQGMTPLMLASREGALATIQVLLRRGADRNFVSEAGETVLTLANFDVRDSIIQLVCNV